MAERVFWGIRAGSAGKFIKTCRQFVGRDQKIWPRRAAEQHKLNV